MFRRLANIIKGFFGLFVSGLERKNPEALLEVEKENLRKQIAQYNTGLAAHAGLVEKLMTQTRRLEKREQELRAKAAANLRAGNREAAANYALELQSTKQELEENITQLEDAEKTYKEMITARDVSIKAARDKIQELQRSLQDLDVKKAQAELAEMASGMITEIGGSGDTLSRLHDMVEEERTKAAGRARVAKDSIDMSEIHMKEEEQKALAEQALADFAALEGLDMGPVADDAVASPMETDEQADQASMGPEADLEKES